MHVKKAANEFGTYYIITSKSQDEIDIFWEFFSKGPVKEHLELLSSGNGEEIKSTSEDRHREYEFSFLMNPDEKFHHIALDENSSCVVIQRLKSPILKKLQILGEEEIYLDFHLCKLSSPLAEIEEYIRKI